MPTPAFRADEVNSDDEYFYVDIVGIGTVQIHKCDDGISVDIYPLDLAEDPVASCWVLYSELNPQED